MTRRASTSSSPNTSSRRVWRASARVRAAQEAARGRGPVRGGAEAAAPLLPRRIGIVTSLDGAALRDIVKVLRRRYPNAHLVDPADARAGRRRGRRDQVARSRRSARVAGVDVVIVGRGGGSAEDLWAFNDERVARAIAGVAGADHLGRRARDRRDDRRLRRRPARADAVGGGRDGRRARGTSSAPGSIGCAAGSASPSAGRSTRGVAGACARGQPRAAAGAVACSRSRAVTSRSSRTRWHAPRPRRPAAHARASAALERRLEARDVRRALADVRARLARAERRLSLAAADARHRADGRFRALAGRLENLSPLAVLAPRLCGLLERRQTRASCGQASEVATGDAVRVKLHEGELDCIVTGETL